ncbi:LacI family DNA-binding transcriptional regulator [Cellulomonas sp. Leaf395]|uniref:LacI family DNA-binding transcriptional regulator n=1 Tax=Cellulomonas sp. Leaf395 TaxID=1736362 RepID=UPI0006F3B87C|nr:LacI family DNA-binding transcriptional regulator [Cellulomonas sp. Leaf395]KQS98955.1 LacI family transcriptional regulator [Cellulomonas sp. Leaf395]
MATIGDVARAAGVSLSTVSYVISGKRPISQPTRERVERAIRELAFHPHAGAQALASARSNVIALMVPFRPGINVAIIMEFVAGVVTAARTFDHDVLLLTEEDVQEIDRVAARSLADAVIVMDVESEDPRLPSLRALDRPAVLIGVPEDTSGLACVDLDFAAAGRLATRTLIDAGHTHIALIGASRERFARRANYAVRMRDGVVEQAARSGLEVHVLPCDPTYAGGSDVLARLLTDHPDVTGLVVHNEAALAGIVDALDRAGRPVPSGMSVVAINVANIAEGLRRPVDSITVPGHDIGRIAVQMAMARLEQDGPGETRLVAPTLTPHGSVAPPA